MDMIERYLAAIARELPPAKRADVIEELRDLLLSRVEAREAALGRKLDKAELQALLRDFGHPLIVASRYRERQWLVGPEVFPFFWGISPVKWEETIAAGGRWDHALLLIDAVAGTPIQSFNGDLSTVQFLRNDLTAIAYHLIDDPETLVIGPGGGRDVLAALASGAPHVAAVEVNPAVIEAVKGPFADFAGHLYDRPDVEAVVADARGYVDRSPGDYDVIQASLIELDPDTGFVKLLKHWCVEDAGTVINPMLVDEQIRGGVVQGIGAAMFEECLYGPDGQLLNGSMADYLVPMSGEMPDIVCAHIETPTKQSQLGAKGVGEAGTAGAPGAIMNAINDALSPFNTSVTAMPFTPERVLKALGKV